jgi:hypothetical protein
MKVFAVIEIQAKEDLETVQDALTKLLGTINTVSCVVSTPNLSDLVNWVSPEYAPVQDTVNWRFAAYAPYGTEVTIPETEEDGPFAPSKNAREIEYPTIYDGEDTPDDRTFTLYHATGPNAFTEVEDQERKYAGWVRATSLEEAFRKSQNTDKPWFINNCRSTSVGDVIQDGKDRYLVCGSGFKLLGSEDEACLPGEVLSEEDMKNESELNALESQSPEC